MSAFWRISLLACCGVLGITAAVSVATLPKTPRPTAAPESRAERLPTVAEVAPAATPASVTAPASSPLLAYPQPPLPATHEPRANESTGAAAVSMTAPLLPRAAQQLTTSATASAPHVPAPALNPAVQPSTLAAGPDIGDALRLLENMSPETRKALSDQNPQFGDALRMLETMRPDQRKDLLERGMQTLDNGQLPIDGLPVQDVPATPKEPSKPAMTIKRIPAKAAETKPGNLTDTADKGAVDGSQVAPQPAPAGVAQPEPVPPGKAAEDRGKAAVTHLPGFDVGDEHLVLNIHDTDLRQVLELLAEQGGLNILASPSVQGNVSASLRDVNIETALDAILKSTGFISRREGKLIFVGTPEEFSKMRTDLDRVSVRVYRLNYVTAKEIQNLLTPLITPNVGKVTVTSPAQAGIAVDSSSAGGDAFASGEAVLVQDYEAVLCQVDQIVREIDRKPMQVAIEAVIVNVTLNDANKWGVDFQFLRDQNTIRFGTGTPRTSALEGSGQPDGTGGLTGEYKFTQGGLQFAFLDATLGAFLTAVETIGDVNVVAHPRLLCLNKQRAQILIGAQIGYVTTNVTQTFSTQTVSFLDVGTQLRLRPYISNDGIVRMEVHPEISDGTVSSAGVPSKNVTQVTTNIMCPDGSTVVIGGLMQESMQTSTNQVPVIGSMPVIGPLFRTKNEAIVRREILVLITPRIIYDPEATHEGEMANIKTHRDYDVASDEMTLLSRTYQSRLLTRRAEAEMKQGRLTRAWRTAQTAVHFNPNNHDAVDLRDHLENQIGRATLRSGGPPPEMPPSAARPHPLDGEILSPWVLDALEGEPAMLPELPHPRDPGGPTGIRTIEPVEPLKNGRP